MTVMKRKVFTSEFKAKVALLAIQGIKTVNEIAQDLGVHATQVSQWNRELQASHVFSRKRGPESLDPSASAERLYSEIGRLKMELDWIKKNSGIVL